MLTGYTDRLTVAGGERVELKVSSDRDYDLAIVRLIQGDDTAAGPGYVEREIGAACDGRYPALVQRTEPGSYVRVDTDVQPPAGVTLLAWVSPTTPAAGRQGVLTRWAADGTGYGLEIVDGVAVFTVRSGADVHEVRAKEPVRSHWWQVIAGGYDAGTGRLFVWQAILDASRVLESGDTVEATADAVFTDAPLLIGASCNGRVSAPRWFGRALLPDELDRAARDGLRDGLLGAWDLGPAQPSTPVLDRSGHGRHGTAVNQPGRGVRGPRWDGTALRPADAPEHYDCMHFHTDDLSDARWQTTTGYDVPPDLPSGIYAARLRTADEEDYLPFVVRPGTVPTARALFVLPTYTFVAYANEHFHDKSSVVWSRAADRPLQLDACDNKIREHPEFGPSLYDAHSDGSYTMYSSRLRPILNFRPKVVAYWSGAGRHLCADLYLLNWLDREGVPVDVVTDEDVHHDGQELLDRYDVVITGSHPEYTTEPMLDALSGYTASGGRIMYLGGNGFWWVTTVDPSAPYVIEVRKPGGIDGTPGVGVLPGEEHHSQTGEKGGNWRFRGRGPETWLGVGYATQGFAQAAPYHRTDASRDPGFGWIFEGVEGDVIGADGLGLGGAAGDEMDAAQVQGTPPQTVVLASSRDHHERYLRFASVYEDPDDANRLCRSDLTYTPTGNGGAVFAAGSMCWYPALAWNDYDNDVARITRNVLTRFLQPPR